MKNDVTFTLYTSVCFSTSTVSLGSTIVHIVFDPVNVDDMMLVDSESNVFIGADINRRILEELSDEMLERLYFNVHRHSNTGVLPRWRIAHGFRAPFLPFVDV